MSRERRHRIYFIREPGKATATPVVWRESSKTFLYHATIDGTTPVCGAPTVLDSDRSPYGVFDGFASAEEKNDARTRDTMTCKNCLDRVRCRVVSKDAPEVVETQPSCARLGS
jgi:hypothetical protein